jgi:hypothetical protein
MSDFKWPVSELELKSSTASNSHSAISNQPSRIHWFARAALTAVLVSNMSAAIPYLIRPVDYVASYELTGLPGQVAVRGLGILFLMWAVPFVPAILNPARHRIAFACVLAMQVIGLAGESLMLAALPAGHDMLRATGLRFIASDGAGLVALLIAYRLSFRADRSPTHVSRNT